MGTTDRLKKWIIENKLLLAIIAIGFFVRLFYIGNIPGNRELYADEAFSGYEAFSMLTSGHDSHGYVRPAYLVAWGSGMNALQSYLIMPFMAIFGVNSFSVRLPQAILGCLTLLAFYDAAKRIRGRQFAILALAVLSVMPYHIMINRWALESNLLPAFLMFGLCFLVRGTKDARWLPLSALCYGLAFYAYAAGWPVMPLIVGGSVLYLLLTKKIAWSRYLVIAAVIFLLLAVPPVLFLMVNRGMIEEIRGGIVSIPRLSYLRSSELSLNGKEYVKRLYDTFLMFIRQDDTRVSDATPLFGIYYKFSYIFLIPGLAGGILAIKSKEHVLERLVWIQLLSGVILGGLVETVFNRVNVIHLPLIYFIALGIWETGMRFGERMRMSIAVLYGIAFIAFLGYYFTYHDDRIADIYGEGTRDAIYHAEEIREEDETIHVLSGVSLPCIYLYAQMDPDTYIETRHFIDHSYTVELIPDTFWHYDYSRPAYVTEELPDYIPGDVYLCNHSDEAALDFMRENGLSMTHFESVVVGQ